MSEYPSDWEIVNLGNLATIKASNVDKKAKEGQKKISLCNYMDVFKNPVVSSALAFMRSTASEKEISEFSLSKGDVLLTKDSEVPEEIGIPSVVVEDIPDLVCGYHLYMVRADRSRINPEYLCWALRSNSSRQYFYQMANGSTRFGLNLKHVEECPIAVPPLPEQKKIAEILSGNQGNLNLVAQEIAKLDNLEKCLLSSLLLSENEGGEWKKVAVSDIGRVIRGASPRPKGDPRYYGGRVPRLMVADVTRDGKYVTPRIDFLTEAGAKLSRPVPAGTLTIVCSGVVGVPSILSVDACIHDGFLAIVDISPECNAEYLYYFFRPLQQILDSSATHGGIFTNLTTEILKDFPVLLPSPARQGEIVKILRSIDSLRNRLLARQSKFACLFESISTDLLSGRKRVSV